jgi:hypothetical protein
LTVRAIAIAHEVKDLHWRDNSGESGSALHVMLTPKRFLEDDDTPRVAAMLLRFLWVPVEASSSKQRALARLLRITARMAKDAQ